MPHDPEPAPDPAEATPFQPAALADALSRLPVDASFDALSALRQLVSAGLDALPLPGGGATRLRWQALATVAAHELSLLKLFEGHTDALAILDELDADVERSGLWGTWCAEPPAYRVAITADGDRLRLNGTKAWCSGAAGLDHALVSGWLADGRRQLAAVALRQPGVHVTGQGWQAVGMAGTASVDVHFDAAIAIAVGAPEAYLQRAGFWHGAGGIAACWHGAALGLASALHDAATQRADAHLLAHLGAVDAALAQSAAMLAQTAARIDASPHASHELLVRRCRLAVEASAERVWRHTTRALGAAPLCRDAAFARRTADLPVFMRQSHAERDQAALGRLLLAETGIGTAYWP